MFGCVGGTGKTKPEKSKEMLQHEKRFNRATKLLLLGTGESGKTTIIKQMKIIHINGFSHEEKEEKIPFIKQNVHESIYDILYNMERINPPVKLNREENYKGLAYILNIGPQQPIEYTEEYYDYVKALWADEGVQETFKRSNEFQLIDSAQHFLDQIDTIRDPSYIPSVQDILFCRIKTVSISEIEFSVPLPKIHGGGSARFLMYDVGGQRGERKKWIQVFDGVQAILFVIAASDFDQKLREDESKNRLEEAFAVFHDIFRSRFVRDAGLIIFLNKQDLLKKKVESGRKLENYFPEYANYNCDNSMSEYDRAKSYMRQKIIGISKTEVVFNNYNPLRQSIVSERAPPRIAYVHNTVATDTNNVRKVFDSVHEIIVTNILKKTATPQIF